MQIFYIIANTFNYKSLVIIKSKTFWRHFYLKMIFLWYKSLLYSNIIVKYEDIQKYVILNNIKFSILFYCF